MRHESSTKTYPHGAGIEHAMDTIFHHAVSVFSEDDFAFATYKPFDKAGKYIVSGRDVHLKEDAVALMVAYDFENFGNYVLKDEKDMSPSLRKRMAVYARYANKELNLDKNINVVDGDGNPLKLTEAFSDYALHAWSKLERHNKYDFDPALLIPQESRGR